MAILCLREFGSCSAFVSYLSGSCAALSTGSGGGKGTEMATIQ
jgi:hypothetical protein